VSKQWKVGVVAFGFGEPASANPNSKIAALALMYAQGDVPIFTDRDVSPHLRGATNTIEEIDPKRMPTTWRLAVMAIERAENYNLNKLHVVAAPCHMWRCLRDLRWAACDRGIEIEFTPQPIEGYQYDSLAQTMYTRAAWIWWPFELAYRIASSVFPRWYKRTRA